MGYPMTYRRIVARNGLEGDYAGSWQQDRHDQAKSMIRGDLRRLEVDQRDERHLKIYAEKAGITVDQAKAVLDQFFSGDW